MRTRRKTARGRFRLWLLLSVGFLLALGLTLTIGAYLRESKTRPVSLQSRVRHPVPVHQAARRPVHLYFASSSGHHLEAEERQIKAADPLSAVQAILSVLLEGPENSALVSPIPAEARVEHLFVAADRTAYVDFSPELSSRHPGGVTAERLTVFSIVNSVVLNLETVERVQLLLEGRAAATLAGHVDISGTETADLLIVR
jgi:hypothetical protein